MRQRASTSLTLKSVVLLLPVFFYKATFAQENCGSIGNSNENAVSAARSRSFYLNIASPAPCTGNITSWRVCYYGPNQNLSSDDQVDYWATYAVYRKMGFGADERYERVSQLFSAVRATNSLIQIDSSGITDGVIQQQGFNCYNDSINAPLRVEAGDVLGACVFDPVNDLGFSRRQLDIVGQVSGESLLQMGTGGCSTTILPTNIQTSQLSTVESRKLHLFANIEPNNNFVITTWTEATSILTATGSIITHNLATTASKPEVFMSSDQSFIPQDQESRVSLIITAAGSTSGAVIICILSLVVVTSVVVCLKRRQKTFQLTSNVAYTGQCMKEDIDYYTVSQPPAGNANSSQDRASATLYNTISDTTIDLEGQQPCKGALTSINTVQNVAYKPLAIPLSPNVAYESHDILHKRTENQDEYDYI